MKIDCACPEVRHMNFDSRESVETVARRIREACLCDACRRLAQNVRLGGRKFLDTMLRPNSGERVEVKS
jgi:hypothetical protein